MEKIQNIADHAKQSIINNLQLTDLSCYLFSYRYPTSAPSTKTDFLGSNTTMLGGTGEGLSAGAKKNCGKGGFFRHEE
jgi:hypothetical protein